MPGDWMSVSTTATRFPEDARQTARLAVRFDLPVPPRYEWMETILAMLRRSGDDSARSARAGRVAGDQHFGPRLQRLKVVRLGDLGDLGGLSLLVNGDHELLDLGAQPAFTGGHFDAHALEESGQVAERVGACADVVQALGRESSCFHRERRRGDLLDAAQVDELEIAGPLLSETTAHAGTQHERIEWLRQIVVRAQRDAARDARRLIERRDHEH